MHVETSHREDKPQDHDTRAGIAHVRARDRQSEDFMASWVPSSVSAARPTLLQPFDCPRPGPEWQWKSPHLAHNPTGGFVV